MSTEYNISKVLNDMVAAPPGEATVKIIFKSEDGIMLCYTTSKPSDSLSGYAEGCICLIPNGSGGAVVYVNEGSDTNSDFNLLITEDNISAQIALQYDLGYGTAGGVGPSPEIWADCPLLAMMLDPTIGYYYFDDFMGQTIDPGATADNGGWTVTQNNAGTIGSVVGAGGELHLVASGTADYGINAQLLNCCVKPTAGKTIWFEARVQISDIDNQIFVGLASTQTAIIATGVLDESSMSAVGFFTDEPSVTTKYGTITSKAGNQDVTEDIAVGLEASTWCKLGIKITGIEKVEFFYDGVLVETGETTASIADAVELALSLVCQNEDGSNTNTLKVDWVRVAQLR